MSERRRLTQAGLLVAMFLSIVLWPTGGVAGEGSSFDAREVMRKGTFELGGVVGYV